MHTAVIQTEDPVLRVKVKGTIINSNPAIKRVSWNHLLLTLSNKAHAIELIPYPMHKAATVSIPMRVNTAEMMSRKHPRAKLTIILFMRFTSSLFNKCYCEGCRSIKQLFFCKFGVSSTPTKIISIDQEVPREISQGSPGYLFVAFESL